MVTLFLCLLLLLSFCHISFLLQILSGNFQARLYRLTLFVYSFIIWIRISFLGELLYILKDFHYFILCVNIWRLVLEEFGIYIVTRYITRYLLILSQVYVNEKAVDITHSFTQLICRAWGLIATAHNHNNDFYIRFLLRKVGYNSHKVSLFCHSSPQLFFYEKL